MIKKTLYGLLFFFTGAVFCASAALALSDDSLPAINFESHSSKTAVPHFLGITDLSKRKETFFKFIYPLVVKQNKKIIEQRLTLERLAQNFNRSALTKKQEKWLVKLAMHYGFNDITIVSKGLFPLLLKRVDYIPPDLVLAQAAIESAWGTSRFAIKANNYFGQWCYQKGCGLIPKQRSNKKTHELRKFTSAEHAIYAYLNNLNSSAAYQVMRDIRKNMRVTNKTFSGTALANGLSLYSQERDVYVRKVKFLIKQNGLERFKQ